MFEEKFKTRTGKICDKWSIYISVYERLLAEFPHISKILEIGVQNGGSLELWALCFPEATHIIGCDIDPRCANLAFDDPRISVIVNNANGDDAETQILAKSPRFDLIVDDGSHRSSDIIHTFARYFRHLNDGGVYVAEDLHCSYWKEFGGGLLHPGSAMAFFKQLADVINYEHWGLTAARKELLISFSRHYGVNFDDDVLAHVHSMEFVNSMCIIRRRAPAENSLGLRRLSGADAAVNAHVLPMANTRSRPFDQRQNPWSALARLAEEKSQEQPKQ